MPKPPQPEFGLEKLVAVMARLRDPEGGCAWDREQTFVTIAPYTIEEAYEVADAIRRGDVVALKDELGDLLLQVVYHARIAEESGAFAIGDVIDAITDKMIRRHPHVFADAERGDWEAAKHAERTEAGHVGALSGVAEALPALKRSEKLQKRAARVGFDWPDAEGPQAKIIEELDELRRADNAAEREEELGDLLFAVANLSRHLRIDPEAALRKANDKFQARFEAMEREAGSGFAALSLEDMERLWQAAKAQASTGSA